MEGSKTLGVSTFEKGHVQHLRVRTTLLHGTVGEGRGRKKRSGGGYVKGEGSVR
jgi:hypothetical protein